MRPAYCFTLLMLFVVTSLCRSPSADAASPPTFRTGSGNFAAGQADAEAQMKMLKAAGANTVRLVIYPQDYGAMGQAPNTALLDPLIGLCRQYDLTPVLLFENYGPNWGDYSTWAATGRAFARHFGTRILEYAAFNEPDGAGTLDKKLYHDCLQGFSDGIKGVNPALRVAPGGFCKPNSMSDWSCQGYLTAIADLYNGHKLDDIDLHLYTNGLLAPGNRGPAPLDLTYTNSAAQFAAQNTFDSCKKVSGITSDPGFVSTEFNYTSPTSPEDGARGFLTAFFDVQGVVGDDGVTRKTGYALVWQIQTLDPDRMKALKTALSLQDAKYVHLDPSLHRARRTGLYVLQRSDASKVYVWHNRPVWSTVAGDHLSLPDMPTAAKHVTVMDWKGPHPDLSVTLRADAPAAQQKATNAVVSLTGLPTDQTLIFVAH